MALGSQKLELIKHEKARFATFKKRKASLVKKANEFSTLCDVDACMIIYGPRHKDQPVTPETWASEEGKLTAIINKYKKSTGKGDHQHQQRKVENKKSKVKDEAVQVCKSKRRVEYATWDQRLDSFSEDQLKKILGRVDTKLEAAGKKLEMMKADMEKATTSEHSLLSHNLSNQNVNCRQQSKRRRKSLDSQQASNFRPNSQLHEMTASHSSFIQTPVWTRLNESILYQSSGPSSSTVPFTPLQEPSHRTSPPSCHTPIRETLLLPQPMRASASSEKSAARLNGFIDFLQLKPPGD